MDALFTAVVMWTNSPFPFQTVVFPGDDLSEEGALERGCQEGRGSKGGTSLMAPLRLFRGNHHYVEQGVEVVYRPVLGVMGAHRSQLRRCCSFTLVI